MGHLDITAKKLVLLLSRQGYSGRAIAQELKKYYSINVSPQAVNKFLLHYKLRRSLERKRGSGRKTIVTPEIKTIIEAKMQSDNETTTTQLQDVLHRSGFGLSLSTLRRCRSQLGWTFHGSKYCQMIREPNKLKRLDWCIKQLEDNDDYHDVIWSDETSVQLSKEDQALKLKPRAKHPVKVHVWAGSSKQGATQVCIFEGKMDADFYLRILWHYLLPFIAQIFHLHIHLCRTTILSTHQENQESFSKKKSQLVAHTS